jgi:hypothetical protein
VLVVESEPAGAHVRVSNGMTGATPATFTLARKGNFVVAIEKEGYEEVRVNVTHKVAPGGSAGMAGNLLLGGIIGAAVDANSGAMFDLVPNPIRVTLVPVRAQGLVPPRPTFTGAADRSAAMETLEQMRALANALVEYRKEKGGWPAGDTVTQIYPHLARAAPVRIADAWGNAFAYGRTPDDGFMLASAGADGVFDASGWTQEGDLHDYGLDAVLRFNGAEIVFLRTWR